MAKLLALNDLTVYWMQRRKSSTASFEDIALIVYEEQRSQISQQD